MNVAVDDDAAAAMVVRRRAGFVVTVVGLTWLVLVGRLIQLQFWQQDELGDRAARQREVVEEIVPRPGDIFDCHGRLLATSVQAQSLYVIPSRLSKPWDVAEQLADALQMVPDDLFERLGRHADKHFLWVKRRLTDEETERVRGLGLPSDIYGFRPEYRRIYPQGMLAAQVIGMRDVDGTGRGGIEEQCDAELKGQAGRRTLTRDARGRVIDITPDLTHPLQDGQSVRLAIDSVMQIFAEAELDKLMREYKPESSCAIVLDPHTGDVLAMASRPTIDPNHPENADPGAWKNRAIADIYEPGSTFKPMIVAYGLDQQLIRRDDEFHCGHGQYRMGRRVLHDHHGYGLLSLTDVLVKSSNIGMAKIGERLTNDGLHAAATRFGFGQPTGIELPGELSGILSPLEKWTSYSTGSIPMGHEIATTPLQLIRAHAALANGGHLVRPRMLLGETDAESQSLTTGGDQIVSADAANWMVSVPMREVITRGTGKKAQIPGYEVFGKTGTAQSLSPSGGYRHGKYIASFVCGAPVEQPQLLVLVVVNQATTGGEAFGGRVAAPAASEILRQSLEYRHVPREPSPSSEPRVPIRAAQRNNHTSR